MSLSSRGRCAHLETLECRRLLAQTPFPGVPFHVATSGTTVIQAEDFDNGGEGVAYHDLDAVNLGGKYRNTGVDIGTTTDVGGGFYVRDVRAGEWLEYTLDVAHEGGYNFAIRTATVGSGGRFHIEINGVDVTESIQVADSNGWQSWIEESPFIELPRGQCVMRIAMDANGARGAVANFNYIKISSTIAWPDGQFPFTSVPVPIAANQSTRVFMSVFDNGGEGVAYHDLDAVNSGKKFRVTGVDLQTTSDPSAGYNLGWTKAGEWTEYTINVAQAGVYTADFHLANAGNNGKFHLEIDGADITGPVTVPNTGGFQTWTTLSKAGVNLPAGQHVLRLKMDANSSNGSVGNFTWVQFSPGGAATTTLSSTVAAYVRDGDFADTNFGSDPGLMVKDSTLSYNREALIKFDLSSISTVGNARLRLFGNVADGSRVDLEIHDSHDVLWDENQVTWNTKPADAAFIGIATISGPIAQWYEVDITDRIRGLKSDGSNAATIIVRSRTFSSGPPVVFNSDDAATNQPQLVVTS